MIQSSTVKRRVCLFGLSADPPTSNGGHGGIVKALADEEFDGAFDEVRVLPVYQHAFSEKRGRMASYQDRVYMCRLQFEGVPNVTVSEAERRCFIVKAEGLNDQQIRSLRVGTADLLEMLKRAEPDTDFTFALGADTFVDLTNLKWRRSRDVIDLLDGRFVIINRIMEKADSQVERDVLQKNLAEVNAEFSGNARTLNIQSLQPVSSSLARACSDEESLRKYVEPSVFRYIKEKRLYGFADARS